MAFSLANLSPPRAVSGTSVSANAAVPAVGHTHAHSRTHARTHISTHTSTHTHAEGDDVTGAAVHLRPENAIGAPEHNFSAAAAEVGAAPEADVSELDERILALTRVCAYTHIHTALCPYAHAGPPLSTPYTPWWECDGVDYETIVQPPNVCLCVQARERQNANAQNVESYVLSVRAHTHAHTCVRALRDLAAAAIGVIASAGEHRHEDDGILGPSMCLSTLDVTPHPSIEDVPDAVFACVCVHAALCVCTGDAECSVCAGAGQQAHADAIFRAVLAPLLHVLAQPPPLIHADDEGDQNEGEHAHTHAEVHTDTYPWETLDTCPTSYAAAHSAVLHCVLQLATAVDHEATTHGSVAVLLKVLRCLPMHPRACNAVLLDAVTYAVLQHSRDRARREELAHALIAYFEAVFTVSDAVDLPLTHYVRESDAVPAFVRFLCGHHAADTKQLVQTILDSRACVISLRFLSCLAASADLLDWRASPAHQLVEVIWTGALRRLTAESVLRPRRDGWAVQFLSEFVKACFAVDDAGKPRFVVHIPQMARVAALFASISNTDSDNSVVDTSLASISWAAYAAALEACLTDALADGDAVSRVLGLRTDTAEMPFAEPMATLDQISPSAKLALLSDCVALAADLLVMLRKPLTGAMQIANLLALLHSVRGDAERVEVGSFDRMQSGSPSPAFSEPDRLAAELRATSRKIFYSSPRDKLAGFVACAIGRPADTLSAAHRLAVERQCEALGRLSLLGISCGPAAHGDCAPYLSYIVSPGFQDQSWVADQPVFWASAPSVSRRAKAMVFTHLRGLSSRAARALAGTIARGDAGACMLCAARCLHAGLNATRQIMQGPRAHEALHSAVALFTKAAARRGSHARYEEHSCGCGSSNLARFAMSFRKYVRETMQDHAAASGPGLAGMMQFFAEVFADAVASRALDLDRHVTRGDIGAVAETIDGDVFPFSASTGIERGPARAWFAVALADFVRQQLRAGISRRVLVSTMRAITRLVAPMGMQTNLRDCRPCSGALAAAIPSDAAADSRASQCGAFTPSLLLQLPAAGGTVCIDVHSLVCAMLVHEFHNHNIDDPAALDALRCLCILGGLHWVSTVAAAVVGSETRLDGFSRHPSSKSSCAVDSGGNSKHGDSCNICMIPAFIGNEGLDPARVHAVLAPGGSMARRQYIMITAALESLCRNVVVYVGSWTRGGRPLPDDLEALCNLVITTAAWHLANSDDDTGVTGNATLSYMQLIRGIIGGATMPCGHSAGADSMVHHAEDGGTAGNRGKHNEAPCISKQLANCAARGGLLNVLRSFQRRYVKLADKHDTRSTTAVWACEALCARLSSCYSEEMRSDQLDPRLRAALTAEQHRIDNEKVALSPPLRSHQRAAALRRAAATPRSRNPTVQKWLAEERPRDAFADLEDFIEE